MFHLWLQVNKIHKDKICFIKIQHGSVDIEIVI